MINYAFIAYYIKPFSSTSLAFSSLSKATYIYSLRVKLKDPTAVTWL